MCGQERTHPVAQHDVHFQPAALLALIEEAPAHAIMLIEEVRLGGSLLIPAAGEKQRPVGHKPGAAKGRRPKHFEGGRRCTERAQIEQCVTICVTV